MLDAPARDGLLAATLPNLLMHAVRLNRVRRAKNAGRRATSQGGL